ncbi:MAG: hypothetical protein ACK6D6_09320 [Planctomyces sp.]
MNIDVRFPSSTEDGSIEVVFNAEYVTSTSRFPSSTEDGSIEVIE